MLVQRPLSSILVGINIAILRKRKDLSDHAQQKLKVTRLCNNAHQKTGSKASKARAQHNRESFVYKSRQ